RVDSYPDPTDFLTELGIVGVVPTLGGQVEGHRQPGPALIQQIAVAAIGLLGRPEARILAERPQLAAIPAREIAAGERIGARRRGFTGSVGRYVDRVGGGAGGGLFRGRLYRQT